MEQQVGVRFVLFSRRDIQGYMVPSKYTRNFVYEYLMSSCRYNWSPASMVIACGHSAFLHSGFQLMASKVQWCKA